MGHQGLIAALCDFQKKVAPIHKLSHAQYGNYADLQTVLAAVTPVLADCGLAVLQTFTTDTQGRTLLVTKLGHISGESEVSVVPLVAEGGRNALHTWGGAVTYQRRYAILAILNLAAGIADDDGDSVGSKLTTTKTPANDDFL